jgi:amidase
MPSATNDYQCIAAEKKLRQSSKIPKDWLIPPKTYQNVTNLINVPVNCGVLSDVECSITSEYDATALLEKLKAGVWSAEQVTTAFCKRAAIAQQLVSKMVLLDHRITLV